LFEQFTEYLAANIPKEIVSYQMIAEAYRQRWAIEVLWKFLKMHLKLDKMMSKSLHGMTFKFMQFLSFIGYCNC